MSPVLLTLAFLAIGLTVGYLAQRSRMCFVAGFRDWILVRDSELLIGLLAFVATVWVISSLFGALGLIHRGMPEYGAAALAAARSPGFSLAGAGLASVPGPLFYASLGGGLLIGALSVLVGGCVMRQHVLCAQGDGDAIFYLIGFYGAVPLFYLTLARLFDWVYA